MRSTLRCVCVGKRLACSPVCLFERLQIRQQITDLIGLELEGRHRRMTGVDAFGQRLSEGLDRVTLVQRPERRRDLERAWRNLVDRMALRAIVQRKGLAALLLRRSRRSRRQGNERKRQRHQNSSDHCSFNSVEECGFPARSHNVKV